MISRSWAEINLGALRRNLRAVRRTLNPGCKVLVPVKADGYGHGVAEAAEALAQDADMFGVTNLEEAAVVRSRGIRHPLLLLASPFPEDFQALLDWNVIPSICDETVAGELAAWLRSRTLQMPIHVKIDTGMGRLGIRYDRMGVFFNELNALPELKLEGVYTHLACADEESEAPSNEQLGRFENGLKNLNVHLNGVPALVHALNSSGLQRFPHAQFGMVRCGGLIYGMNLLPVHLRKVAVEEAFFVKTLVLSVKKVKGGEGVGYGAAYRAPRDMRIAVLGMGYGEGLFRMPESRVPVLLGGNRRFLAGRISMNVSAAALEDGDRVSPGDIATFIGVDGGERISLDEAAAPWKTIPYEVTCRLGKALPRKYFDSGKP
jgi:alanine racemase